MPPGRSNTIEVIYGRDTCCIFGAAWGCAGGEWQVVGTLAAGHART